MLAWYRFIILCEHYLENLSVESFIVLTHPTELTTHRDDKVVAETDKDSYHIKYDPCALKYHNHLLPNSRFPITHNYLLEHIYF
jgi:hypothetical protein